MVGYKCIYYQGVYVGIYFADTPVSCGYWSMYSRWY